MNLHFFHIDVGLQNFMSMVSFDERYPDRCQTTRKTIQKRRRNFLPCRNFVALLGYDKNENIPTNPVKIRNKVTLGM